MMGSFLTRALVMLLGYAYPAYECYKTVELNKPEIEQLRFWCQYWILVALLTVFERVGDTFVSWLPMYSEAKLAFYVYLWYPKTRGTLYVYDTFFRPYIAKHETEIDRNLLELRTRAGDMLVLYWQRAASFGQTRFFEILQYVASQSQAPRSRPAQQRPQQQQPQQARQTPAAATPARQPAVPPARQPAASHQAQEAARAPPSPTKSQSQGQQPTKSGSHPQAAAPEQPQTSSAAVPASSETVTRPSVSEEEPMQLDTANSTPKEDSNSALLETAMEEAIRMTRGRLRKRAMGAAAGPSAR